MIYKLEYIWMDGYTPEPNLRSKTKVLTSETEPELESLPIWNFDGSSTEQAEGNYSDCLLKPVKLIRDPQRKNGYLVLCEVLNPDMTPHSSNTRSSIKDNSNMWVGFEQEYFIYDGELPLGHTKGNMKPQGEYYCGIGTDNVSGRNIVEHHLDICLSAGLNVTGINAEVAAGQWEFQIFAKGAKEAGDQIWVARYLLERTAEAHGVTINWHCKPLGDTDWNGSGMHANFSNTTLRTCGDEKTYIKIMEAFGANVKEHIDVYGPDNHLRLTGKHETASINDFSYGVSDRGASIRIPVVTVEKGWKGYLEDRRPNSAADPYKVAAVIIKTVKSAR